MNDLQNLVSNILSEGRVTNEYGVTREILEKGVNLHKDLALVIQGVRRCGKSTLLRQLARKLGVETNAAFINFEDPRLSESLNHNLLDAIVSTHEKQKDSKPYYFFDEIQAVHNWEKWLHIQLEKKQRYFVVTGSNRSLLGGKLAGALTGRHISFELFPFSFEEYKKIFPSGSLENYLEQGGFPRALTYERPSELLRQYFTDIIERDVRRQVAARSTLLLTQTAKAVFESTGSELSYRVLAQAFDSSPDTMKVYLDAFEAAYLVLSCDYFTYSQRKSAVRLKKYYPIDLGMRASIVTRSGLDLGKKLETLVLYMLRRKFSKVWYWKQKKEVDFVVETNKGILPIQVSWNEPKTRHLKALKEFKKEHPKSLDLVFINHQNLFSTLKAL